MGKRKAKRFVLTVVDHDKNEFSIEGPMSDDTAWNAAVVHAQELGRNVRCYSGDGSVSNPEQAAADWLRDYPFFKRVPPRTIVAPA